MCVRLQLISYTSYNMFAITGNSLENRILQTE